MRKANPNKRTISKETLFSQEEWEQVSNSFNNSTCRTYCEFSRKILLQKPITVFYRDKTLDELLNHVIQLRNEMQAITEKAASGPVYDRLVEIFENLKVVFNQIVAYACNHPFQTKNKEGA